MTPEEGDSGSSAGKLIYASMIGRIERIEKEVRDAAVNAQRAVASLEAHVAGCTISWREAMRKQDEASVQRAVIEGKIDSLRAYLVALVFSVGGTIIIGLVATLARFVLK